MQIEIVKRRQETFGNIPLGCKFLFYNSAYIKIPAVMSRDNAINLDTGNRAVFMGPEQIDQATAMSVTF